MTPDPEMMDHFKVALASAAGGLVRLLFRPGKTWGKTLWVMMACITCGYYATMPVVYWLDLPPQMVGAVGALCGFIGLSVAEGALQLVDSVDLKKLSDRIIRRFIG